MNIKKVTLNYPYGCWFTEGPNSLTRMYVSFSKDKVEFVRKTMDESHYSLPDIHVSFNPLIENSYQSKTGYQGPLYVMQFDLICHTAEQIKKSEEHIYMCDAIPASLEIEYDDGNVITVKDISNDSLFKALDRAARILVPSEFKYMFYGKKDQENIFDLDEEDK